MENQNEPIYVGNGKQVHSNICNVSICLDDAAQHAIEYNGKKYLNVQVIQKKEVDQYGKTHFVKINDYNPNNQKTQAKKEPVSAGTGLPF